jgi:hypothetical protein
MSHGELIKALKLYPAILKDFVAAIAPGQGSGLCTSTWSTWF